MSNNNQNNNACCFSAPYSGQPVGDSGAGHTMPYTPVSEIGDTSTQPYDPTRAVGVNKATTPWAPDDGTTKPVGYTEKYLPPTTYAPVPSGPVVGWVVILTGEGRGTSMPVTYGRNSIGRGGFDAAGRQVNNSVTIPFNDNGISRSAHAYIIHDPKSHKTFLRDGEDGRNLVYLDGAALLMPTEIHTGSMICLGKTHLMYVEFCNAERDWSQIPEEID